MAITLCFVCLSDSGVTVFIANIKKPKPKIQLEGWWISETFVNFLSCVVLCFHLDKIFSHLLHFFSVVFLLCSQNIVSMLKIECPFCRYGLENGMSHFYIVIDIFCKCKVVSQRRWSFMIECGIV